MAEAGNQTVVEVGGGVDVLVRKASAAESCCVQAVSMNSMRIMRRCFLSDMSI